jgi:hypothetical protein
MAGSASERVGDSPPVDEPGVDRSGVGTSGVDIPGAIHDTPRYDPDTQQYISALFTKE